MKCPECEKEMKTILARDVDFYYFDEDTDDESLIYCTDLEMRWCKECSRTSGPIEV